MSYQKGSRYTYKYSTETSVFLLESRSASSGLALDSLADIEVLHKCLMVLKVRRHAFCGREIAIPTRQPRPLSDNTVCV